MRRNQAKGRELLFDVPQGSRESPLLIPSSLVSAPQLRRDGRRGDTRGRDDSLAAAFEGIPTVMATCSEAIMNEGLGVER